MNSSNHAKWVAEQETIMAASEQTKEEWLKRIAELEKMLGGDGTATKRAPRKAKSTDA